MLKSFLSKDVSTYFPVLNSYLQVGYGLFNATFQLLRLHSTKDKVIR